MSSVNNERKATKYIIRVKNHLDPHWQKWFEGMTITHTRDGETDLTGYVVDQCALHGLLGKIRDLNLTLISVQKVNCVDV